MSEWEKFDYKLNSSQKLMFLPYRLYSPINVIVYSPFRCGRFSNDLIAFEALAMSLSLFFISLCRFPACHLIIDWVKLRRFSCKEIFIVFMENSLRLTKLSRRWGVRGKRKQAIDDMCVTYWSRFSSSHSDLINYYRSSNLFVAFERFRMSSGRSNEWIIQALKLSKWLANIKQLFSSKSFRQSEHISVWVYRLGRSIRQHSPVECVAISFRKTENLQAL